MDAVKLPPMQALPAGFTILLLVVSIHLEQDRTRFCNVGDAEAVKTQSLWNVEHRRANAMRYLITSRRPRECVAIGSSECVQLAIPHREWQLSELPRTADYTRDRPWIRSAFNAGRP